MALTPHYPRFRITLDEPYDFAREPGYVRGVHCHDFREDALSLKENVWRCPITGLVFLKPSWLDENFADGFVRLSDWNLDADYWKEARRSADELTATPGLFSAPMVTSVNPGSMGGLINWTVQGAVAWVGMASTLAGDDLRGALLSKFSLAEDEGFVLHCNNITDAIRRHRNWIAVQWDNLQLHVRPNGQFALYRFPDRAVMGDISDAELVEEIFLSSPGEMADKDTYVMVIPIASMGILVYTSHTPQRMGNRVSSARSGSVKGHLFEVPSEERPDSDGNFRITRSSPITVSFTRTPKAAHLFNIQRLRYPSVGTYLDAIFSLPYAPIGTEAQVIAGALPTGRGTLSGALMKPDDSAAFAAGGRQARVKAIFANSGSGIYTPFLLSTYVRFARVMTTRDTTPLLLTNDGGTWDVGGAGEEETRDLLQRLEFAEGDDGRIEGKATVYARSDHLKAILRRGDCTWKIERQDDAEAAWETVTGGLAQWEDSDVEVHLYDAGDDNTLGFGEGTRRRMAAKATLSLHDMWSRFPEVHQTLQAAFDGLTLKEAINTVLQASGFAPLGGTVPPEMDGIRLPGVPKGENWRHGTQEGDDGGHILRQILLYPRKQLTQFRLLYDWDTAVWTCEKVSKLTGPDNVFWWFTPDADEAIGNDNPEGAPEPEFRVEYGNSDPVFTFRVYRPEANIIRPFGMEKPGADAKRVPSPPLVNHASLEDTDSRDYLGRACMATPTLAPLADELMVAKFGRMIYDAIAHRRLLIQMPASGYEPLLLPGTPCDVRGLDSTGELVTLFQGWWLRRKTVVIDYLANTGDIPQSIYILDEQWDLPID